MGIVPKNIPGKNAHKSYSCSARPSLTVHRKQSAVLLDFLGEKTAKTLSHHVMGPWFYYPSISIPVTKPLSTMRLPACFNPNLSRPMFPSSRPPWRIETSSTPRGSKHCPIESTPQLQRPNHLELEPWNWPTLRLFPCKLTNCVIHQSINTHRNLQVFHWLTGHYEITKIHDIPTNPSLHPNAEALFRSTARQVALPMDLVVFFGPKIPCWLINFDRYNYNWTQTMTQFNLWSWKSEFFSHLPELAKVIKSRCNIFSAKWLLQFVASSVLRVVAPPKLCWSQHWNFPMQTKWWETVSFASAEKLV